MILKRFKSYNITSGGGTTDININSVESNILLTGNTTLTSSWTFQPTGENLKKSMYLNIIYDGNINLNGNNITIFGVQLTEKEAASKIFIRAMYNGTSWTVIKAISNDDLKIDTSEIEDDSLNGSVLVTGSVTAEQIGITSEASILKGRDDYGTYGSEELTLTANQMITMDGTEIVAGDVVGDITMSVVDGDLVFTIGDNVIDVNNLAAITRGSIIRGVAGNEAELHDAKTDGNFVGGTGTDVKSLGWSGDAEAEYDSENDTMEISVRQGSLEKTTYTYNGIINCLIYTDLQTGGKLDGNTNSIFEVNQGDVIQSITAYVKTASSGGTLDIEFYGTSSQSLIQNIDLTTTGSTTEIINDIGFYECPVDGNIRVQASEEISGSEVSVVIKILKA